MIKHRKGNHMVNIQAYKHSGPCGVMTKKANIDKTPPAAARLASVHLTDTATKHLNYISF